MYTSARGVAAAHEGVSRDDESRGVDLSLPALFSSMALPLESSGSASALALSLLQHVPMGNGCGDFLPGRRSRFDRVLSLL